VSVKPGELQYEATKHSFGTRYVNDGVSKDLLKEWFGHTKIEMTQRYAKIKVVEAFRQLTRDTMRWKIERVIRVDDK